MQQSRYYGAPCIIPLTAVSVSIVLFYFVLKCSFGLPDPSAHPVLTLIVHPGGVPDFILKWSFVILTSKHLVYYCAVPRLSLH
ncbi:hypothetical protein L4C36_15170, partial [Photobacterium japonica]|uniref:hypothetical protein n=1 Tax=Photobacterium japonica TaxID=2910235 RepID=UPI003D0A91F4